MFLFSALDQETISSYRTNKKDVYNQQIEDGIALGEGYPCRCCLKDIPKDAAMLTLAHRPFEGLHPYAETGPIFLCADCDRADDSDEIPDVIQTRQEVLIKGYHANERIAEGTGKIIPTMDIADAMASIFARPDVASAHIRSATNNCYFCKITRS